MTALFRLVMDHAANLIFVKDRESRFLYANRAMLELYPPEKRDGLIGTTGTDSFSDEDNAIYLREDKLAFERGRSEVVEKAVDYLGRKRVLQTLKIAFQDEDGQWCLLGICTDIGELVARESALVAANQQLEQFGALAAHDLRSPLLTMISGLDLIKEDEDSRISPHVVQIIDQLVNLAESLADQIQGLLLLSRARHADDQSNFGKVDMNLLLEELEYHLSGTIAQSGGRIVSSRLPVVQGEKTLLRQLFQNLIENSLKYAVPGRPPLITIKCHSDPGHYLFTIEDNGQGVAAKALAKVFEMYEQDAETSVGGVGLGLALCKRIVELHQGTIAIDPDFAEGCRVVIRLPDTVG